MQPRPRVETSRSEFPRARVLLITVSFLLVDEIEP
jgi:hypothetical protein